MALTALSRVTALLQRAIDSHHRFEQEQLQGVYDLDWPAWYAGYLLEQHLGASLRRQVSAEELAALLERSTKTHRMEAARLSWAKYTAREIIARFG